MSGINIYVGNLSFNADEDQLRQLFEAYGRVDSAKIISDQATGRSRGFGFVEMAEREDGMRAIRELDAKEFNGRSLRVNEARPKRGGAPGGGPGSGGGRRERRESRW